MWDQWSRLLLRGRNPEPMTSALIKYAILWVRYDRKIGGRARNLDVFDFRANMNRQMLSDRGEAAPSERSSARILGSTGTCRLAMIPASLPLLWKRPASRLPNGATAKTQLTPSILP